MSSTSAICSFSFASSSSLFLCNLALVVAGGVAGNAAVEGGNQLTNEVWENQQRFHRPPGSTHGDPKKMLKVSSLSWTNCGSSSDPLRVSRLDFDPGTLHFPTDFNVSYAATLREDVGSPIKTWVTVKRKFGLIWIKVPCEHDLGSCYYSDFCKEIPKLQVHLPPSVRCPFQKGDYSGDDVGLYLPNIHFPRWLVKGKYGITVDMRNESGARVGCVKFDVKLK